MAHQNPLDERLLKTSLAKILWHYQIKPRLIKDGDCLILVRKGKILRDRGGYRRFKLGPLGLQAHRIAYAANNGNLRDGLLVCHRCETPSCCNPKHLYLGTHRDNISDAGRNGRMARRWPISGQKKLDPEKVRAIKSSRQTGQSLAEKYGVSRSMICAIRKGRAWSWVD